MTSRRGKHPQIGQSWPSLPLSLNKRPGIQQQENTRAIKCRSRKAHKGESRDYLRESSSIGSIGPPSPKNKGMEKSGAEDTKVI